MSIKNYTNMDTNTKDLRELLDMPPSWLWRGGLFLILSTILIIFSLSVFIRYPEVLQTPLEFDIDQEGYYGTILLPHTTLSKVKEQQKVSIKIRTYPYQGYNELTGKIVHISSKPTQDSLFVIKVSLNQTKQNSVLKLKPGTIADAEIITKDQPIIKRIWANITKSLKSYSLSFSPID